MNSDFAKVIIEALATVLGAFVSIYLIPFLKSRVFAQNWNEILSFTEKCVQAAEKIYTPDQWENKKEYVYNLVTKRAAVIGIDIDSDDIDAIIEGFVKSVKG